MIYITDGEEYPQEIMIKLEEMPIGDPVLRIC
jgi:hypothetical protein